MKGKNPYDILTNLLENNAVFKITNGIFNSKELKYEFSLNGNKQFVSLEDSKISGYKIFKDYFGKHSEVLRQRKLECGSFKFEFYIFDFATQNPQYHLATQEKDIIRQHRIYLYRDGINIFLSHFIPAKAKKGVGLGFILHGSYLSAMLILLN